VKVQWCVLAILIIITVKTPLSQGQTRLSITGSSTVAPLMSEIAKRYEAAHSGTRVDVQTGGSSRGIADVRRKVADIGLVSRGLYESESDLIAHTIAFDGIAVIVHRDNPLEDLSSDLIRAIYLGQHSNWKELGGKDQPIVVVSKAAGRSTLDLFLKFFSLNSQKIKSSVIIGDNAQGLKTVAGHPGAIGYVSIGAALVESSLGAPVRLLGLNSIPPTMKQIRAGRFPLIRPLNLVTLADSEKHVMDFIAFARSPAVKDLIEEFSFVEYELKVGFAQP